VGELIILIILKMITGGGVTGRKLLFLYIGSQGDQLFPTPLVIFPVARGELVGAGRMLSHATAGA